VKRVLLEIQVLKEIKVFLDLKVSKESLENVL